MNPSSFVFMSAWTCFLFYIDAKRILQAFEVIAEGGSTP